MSVTFYKKVLIVYVLCSLNPGPKLCDQLVQIISIHVFGIKCDSYSSVTSDIIAVYI